MLRRTPSTSTYVQRISAEQAAIEDRLVELGVDNIQQMLNKTNLDASPEDKMNVDQPQPQQQEGPRPIGAKQRALAKFVSLRILYSAAASPYQSLCTVRPDARRSRCWTL